MARPDTLDEQETRLMTCLWDKGNATAVELAAGMAEAEPLSHARMLALLDGLIMKGAATRHRVGSHVRYRPCITKATARTHALGRILCGPPANDTGSLGVVVLRETDIDPDDWADLQAEIAAKRERQNRSS